MKNYKMLIEYDGTRYKGWQKQGNTDATIQGKLESILSKMTGTAVEIHGSGRTDAGVHARGQVANFKCHTEKCTDEIMDYINRYLPSDIRVLSLEECDMRFHSRLNAVSKSYTYTISIGKPDVFRKNFVYSAEKMPSVEKMREAAKLLCGKHDFIAFSSLKRSKKSTVRTVFSIDIVLSGNEIIFTYTGNGFLYNMVRILTGTLYEIGTGKRPVTDIQRAFSENDRSFAGETFPPCGLILNSVSY